MSKVSQAGFHYSKIDLWSVTNSSVVQQPFTLRGLDIVQKSLPVLQYLVLLGHSVKTRLDLLVQNGYDGDLFAFELTFAVAQVEQNVPNDVLRT